MKKIFSKSSEEISPWPILTFDTEDQPHFLFIITPPYSGSTVLSELLNTSHRTMILQERGEGQWLIPGLCEKDRWSLNKKINYDSLKSVWLNTYQKMKRLTQTIDVVIEKSPPNMMRIEEISALFTNYSFIANNRDPYANCASILYRHHDAENITFDQRQKFLKEFAENWVIRSIRIRDLILKLDIPLLTYEKFCQNPSLILKILDLPDGVTKSINPDAKVKIKDYKVQTISNQNKRQISKLTNKEINYISHILEPNNKVLKFFGYKLMKS